MSNPGSPVGSGSAEYSSFEGYRDEVQSFEGRNVTAEGSGSGTAGRTRDAQQAGLYDLDSDREANLPVRRRRIEGDPRGHSGAAKGSLPVIRVSVISPEELLSDGVGCLLSVDRLQQSINDQAGTNSPKIIDLSGCILTQEIMDFLGTVGNVIGLKIRPKYYGTNGENGHWGCLFDYLNTHAQELKYLSLEGVGVSDEGARLIAPSLERMTALETLEILTMIILEDSLKLIMRTFANMESLRELDLSGSLGLRGGQDLELDSLEQLQVLSDSLQNLFYLEACNLSDWEIRPNGAEVLLDRLLSLSNIKRIDVSGNHLGDEGAHILAQKIEEHNSEKLEFLRIDGCEIMEAGWRELIPILRRLPNYKIEEHANSIARFGL